MPGGRARIRQIKATTLSASAATSALSPFGDGASVQPWAYTSLAYAVQTGLINGESAGALDPAGTATRTQAATVLVRYLFGPSGN